MASFDKAIPPGREGKITLRINTKGYQAAHRWSALVNSNDPNMNVVYLRVKAFVRPPIFVSGRYINLYGTEGESVTRTIDIMAGSDKPLTLIPVAFDLEGKVDYAVEEVRKGRRFRVRFTSIPGPPQTYRGLLRLKTNYPEKPIITVRIKGRFIKQQKDGSDKGG